MIQIIVAQDVRCKIDIFHFFVRKCEKALAFFPFMRYNNIIQYPKANTYIETDNFSLKKDIYYRKTVPEPMTDVPLTRCPDIMSFHFSLDRIFGESYEFAGEKHPFWELVYVLGGSVGITAGEKIYTLDAGQCLLHPPNEFHRIRSERGTEPHVLNLSFHSDSMPAYQGRIFMPDSDLREELLEISMEVRTGLHNSDAALLSEQRVRFEYWLLRALRSVGEGGATESSGALRYGEIINVMRAHIGEALSAEEIARLCNMSLSNLKKVFTRYAGMGVARYFTEMKMQRAAELLRTGKRVGEVAAELGYGDQNYFSTVFRRIRGTPPGSYRG